MPAHVEVRVVDVYPYRLGEEGPRFLLLRRAAGRVYEGHWRMVGGKVETAETAWEAALRETHEETGRAPRRLWVVPSLNSFYEWQHDRVNLIPAFAAELEQDPILDAEHDEWAWMTEEEAVARLRWPEQRRLLRLVARMLEEGAPPELEIPLGRAKPPRRG